MTKSLSPQTIEICSILLGEYTGKCDQLDPIIFRDIKQNEAVRLLRMLEKAKINPETEIPKADLSKLSNLFTTIGAYTAPFEDTKKIYPVNDIYKAADEFVDYAKSIGGHAPA